MVLAVASIADVEVARTVLGPGADKLIEDALARGLVAVTDRKALSLHPLLRELLIQRFGEADADARQALLCRCRNLFDAQRWDEALSVAEIAGDAVFATEAIAAALDDLLAAGRTSSLQRWVGAARSAGAEGGLIDYAESEALFRGDELDSARGLATQAARSLVGDLAARAHLVAGRSAHLTDNPSRSGHHADLAAAAAETVETLEGALWLRYLSALEQEAPDLTERVEEFRAAAQSGLKQSLMVAAAALGGALIEGGLPEALDNARDVLALASRGVDPIAHTGFLSVYSGALLLNGRYEEALEHLDALTTLAVGNAIAFAIPYAQIERAKALIGLRRFAPATRTLSLLERQMQDKPRGYFHGRIQTERGRLYASVGDLERALRVLSLGPPAPLPRTGASGFLGWQALLTAVSGDLDRAKVQVADARRAGRGLEAESLALLTEAVIALGEGEPQRGRRSAQDSDWGRSLRSDRNRGTCRTSPWVLHCRAAAVANLAPADPRHLAGRLSGGVTRSTRPKGGQAKTGLSPREAEVHDLLAQGLTNEEIAKLLHISVSTTKVHVKHIFEKLGVRSRLEAARALGDDV